MCSIDPNRPFVDWQSRGAIANFAVGDHFLRRLSAIDVRTRVCRIVQDRVDSSHRQLSPLELAVVLASRRKLEACLLSPSRNGADARLDRESFEHQMHRTLHGLVRIELEARSAPHVARRGEPPQFATTRLVETTAIESKS